MSFEDNPGYEELAIEQAHAFLERTPRPYSEEALRWMVKGLLSRIENQALQVFLASHEQQIASGQTDELSSTGWTLLQKVFRDWMGRDAGMPASGAQEAVGRVADAG